MFKVVTLNLKQLMTVYGLALSESSCDSGIEVFEREIETENGIENKRQ